MKRGRGMVLGKFMPPHRGHVYLVEFARQFVDELTVVVGTLQREPIPGELRWRWMRELFPETNVVHLTDELPQDPSEHPEFWPLWRASLQRILPYAPDYVFASESYGVRLAQELGAKFIPVDPTRTARVVSGTAVRTDPMKHWDMLPDVVRPYFVKRVCVFGPESTGKSTLARALAERFATVWVPEYARALLEAQGGKVCATDMPFIARGQAAAEMALSRQANRVLVSDTDALATVVWSQALFGACDPDVTAIADEVRADLTIVTDVDVPWVQDGVRFFPEERKAFLAACIAALESRGRRYIVVSGSHEERLAKAAAAVDQLIGA